MVAQWQWCSAGDIDIMGLIPRYGDSILMGVEHKNVLCTELWVNPKGTPSLSQMTSIRTLQCLLYKAPVLLW